MGEESSNRLDVAEDGNSAICEIVGIYPFVSTMPMGISYESSLAMKLAIDHLNNGDGSIVEEVTDLNDRCPLTFSTSFEDTRRNPAHAFSVVDEYTKSTPNDGNGNHRKHPCAFVGAIDSQISKATSMVTGLRGVPQISPGSTSTALSDKKDFPLFGRTVSDDSFVSELFVRFLHDTLGVRHFFVIFESHLFTRSIHKNLREAIHKLGWEPGRDSDATSGDVLYMEDRIIESRTSEFEFSEDLLYESVEALKESQYRFVLALTTDKKVLDRLMEVAYEAGLVGNGLHHWWAFENLEHQLNGRTFPKDSDLARIFPGVGNIKQVVAKGDTYSRFIKQSKELKRKLYDEYHSTTTINNSSLTGENEWFFAPEVPVLNESEWLVGEDYRFNPAKYAYDATILLGLSACRAVSNKSTLFLSGTDYFEFIKQTSFAGVSGNVVLDKDTGTRVSNLQRYAIHNWLPIDVVDATTDTTSGEVMFLSKEAYVFEAASGSDNNADWKKIAPFVYNGGATELGKGDPGLPTVEITLNVVRMWVLVLAWGLAALILLANVGFAVWTCRHRKSRVVRASQPFFLLLLCFGIALMTASIIPITFEHWYYFQTTATCHWFVWLFTIGFGITFSTLFAKTYRVNTIIASSKKCRRVKISVTETLYPVAIMLIFNIIMLSLMTNLAPITHEDFLTNEDVFGRPTEEFRYCDYTNARPFIYAIFGVNFAMVFLALFQAWRARNLSTEFAESRHINNALLINLIVLLCAVPVMYLTQKNPDVDTFISTVLVSVISSTVLCFIFVPKIRIYHNPSSRSSSRLSIVSSSSLKRSSNFGSFAEGEKILTTKPQEELAREMKRLQRENDALKKKENSLRLQLEKYKKSHPNDDVSENELGGTTEIVSEDYDSDADDESIVHDDESPSSSRRSSVGGRVSSIFASVEMRLRSNRSSSLEIEAAPKSEGG